MSKSSQSQSQCLSGHRLIWPLVVAWVAFFPSGAVVGGADESDLPVFQSADVPAAVEFLDRFWNCQEQVLIAPQHIAASIDVIERISHKVDQTQTKLLYKLTAKMLSAIVRDPGNMASWLTSLIAAIELMPTEEEHYDLVCRLCDPEFDHVRKMPSFLNIIYCLFLRFSCSQMRAFLDPALRSLKIVPHLDVFCSYVPVAARLDLLKYVASFIADSRLSLFPNTKGTKLRFQWKDHQGQLDRILILNMMGNYMQLHPDLIDFLLDIARNDLDRTREHHFIVIKLMSLNPQLVHSHPRLLFKLLSLRSSRFRSQRKYFRTIVSNAPDHYFKLTDPDFGTLLGAYVEFDEIDIPTFQRITSCSHPETITNVQRKILDSHHPQFWHSLFAECNLRSLRATGIQHLFDRLFQSHQNREKLEAFVLLHLFGKDTFSRELNDALTTYEIPTLLKSCRNTFRSFSVSLGHSIIGVLESCRNKTKLAEVVRLLMPTFANPDIAAKFLSFHVDHIVLCSKDCRMRDEDLGLRVHSIGKSVASVCQKYPWLCDAFVSLFTFFFHHHDSLLFKCNMNFDASVACLYVLSKSVKRYRFQPSMRVSQLVCGSLDSARELHRTKRHFRALAQSIAAISIRILQDPHNEEVAIRFSRGQLKRLPLSMLRRPFRAAWPEKRFPRFADTLLSHASEEGVRAKIMGLKPLPSPSPAPTCPNPNIGNRRLRVRKITNIADDYELISQIGQGSFGTVYRARIGDHIVAIKKMGLYDACVAAESEFMATYCHSNQIPGLVQLFDIAYTDFDMYFVMELIEGQMLHDWAIPTDLNQAAKDFLSYVYQFMLILHRLHEQNWMHGDLNHLGNFLLEKSSNKLVLVDFGFSRRTKGDCGDGAETYDRLMDLLVRFKHAFNCAWYEPAPEPIRAFENLLLRWEHHHLRCSEFLRDPVFHELRSDQCQRITDQALKFPIQPEFETIDPNNVRDQRFVLSPAKVLQRQSKSLDHKTCKEVHCNPNVSSMIEPSTTARALSETSGRELFKPGTCSQNDGTDCIVCNSDSLSIHGQLNDKKLATLMPGGHRENSKARTASGSEQASREVQSDQDKHDAEVPSEGIKSESLTANMRLAKQMMEGTDSSSISAKDAKHRSTFNRRSDFSYDADEGESIASLPESSSLPRDRSDCAYLSERNAVKESNLMSLAKITNVDSSSLAAGCSSDINFAQKEYHPGFKGDFDGIHSVTTGPTLPAHNSMPKKMDLDDDDECCPIKLGRSRPKSIAAGIDMSSGVESTRENIDITSTGISKAMHVPAHVPVAYLSDQSAVSNGALSTYPPDMRLPELPLADREPATGNSARDFSNENVISQLKSPVETTYSSLANDPIMSTSIPSKDLPNCSITQISSAEYVLDTPLQPFPSSHIQVDTGSHVDGELRNAGVSNVCESRCNDDIALKPVPDDVATSITESALDEQLCQPSVAGQTLMQLRLPISDSLEQPVLIEDFDHRNSTAADVHRLASADGLHTIALDDPSASSYSHEERDLIREEHVGSSSNFCGEAEETSGAQVLSLKEPDYPMEASASPRPISSTSHDDDPNSKQFFDLLTKHALLITGASMAIALISSTAAICMCCRKRSSSKWESLSSIYPISA